MTVNLLELTDTNAAILINEAVIEPGSYEWLAMDIAAERNVRDSYVMTETGGEEEIELRVPSGRVRLVSGFEVPPNRALRLLFDWDMRRGLVFPPGQGQYMLKPAFRMLEVTAYVPLQGTISSTTVGTDLEPQRTTALRTITSISASATSSMSSQGAVTPDDVDEGTDDPIATVEATRNAAGDYVYRTLIAPGTYTVVFSCEAGNDDPVADDEITFLSPVGASQSGRAHYGYDDDRQFLGQPRANRSLGRILAPLRRGLFFASAVRCGDPSAARRIAIELAPNALGTFRAEQQCRVPGFCGFSLVTTTNGRIMRAFFPSPGPRHVAQGTAAKHRDHRARGSRQDHARR